MVIGRLACLAFALLTVACCAVYAVSASYARLSLDGSDWTLRNSNGSISVPATVPGVVHLDLIAASVIGDPYYRFNERELRWIVYEPSWQYSRNVSVDAALLRHRSVELNFDGLDTVATVLLNGQLLHSSSNMFRRATIDVRHALVAGSNSIEVRFASPALAAAAYHSSYPYDLPVSDPADEIPYRNYLRKAQSDFAWDWGPGFAPSGIWKPVELRAFDEAVITDLTFIAQRDGVGSSWTANVTVYLRVSNSSQAGSITAAVAGVSNTLPVTLPACDPANGDEVAVVSLLLNVDQPDLWWPVGYGAPSLYTLSVTWAGSTETQTVTKQVGFRSIRIVREQIPAGEPGKSMIFEVNSVPIFAKGSNLVPFDAFHPRVTVENITRMMEAALLGNQNIIRIWGGGIFQHDAVYDFADTRGLLIWQEFLFACGFYSVDSWFLNSVREEVTQAVRRLASHASLSVFGGNNENEAALGWQQETIIYRDRYLVDYDQLYIRTVRDALVREVGDDSIEFQASSPSNGPLTLHPYTLIWGDPYNSSLGDNHWYNYGCDCSDVKSFPRSRFISEFGFQSFPSFSTWRGISESDDWAYRSDLSLYRQHHDGGQDQMEYQIRLHFNFPSASDAVQLFEDTLYMTQVQQAFCYGMAVHFWRRIKQEFVNGLGGTMGIIYWQLNDIWQAPTWASLEWGGRWKVVHYTLRSVFAPRIVSAYVEDIGSPTSSLFVYVVSDVNEAQKGTVAVNLRLWSTGAVLATQSLQFTLAPLAASRILNSTVDAFTRQAGDQCNTVTACFIQLLWLDGQQVVVSEYVLMLGKLAPAPLANPNIRLTLMPPQQAHEAEQHRHARLGAADAMRGQLVGSVQVNVSGSAPAAWVFLQTETLGYFDNNGFVLLPDAPRLLTFTGYEPFDVAAFNSTLQLTSIWDVTNRD